MPARKRPAPDEACSTDTGKKRRTPAKRGAKKKQKRYEFDDINHYEFLEEIGEGAFGVVAKARDRRTGETVAVKWIRGGLELEAKGGSDSLLPAVVREAGCLAACRGHPGIVQFKTVAAGNYDTTGDDDDLYIVMELVPDAATLRSVLATRGTFSEDETRDVMRQLLGAAERLHATGAIHRDINPDNILVAAGDTGELIIKLCGFGCATKASRVVCPEKPVGTAQYRAPQQMFGRRRYGTSADVWALGCVMFELLAGFPLFAPETEDVLFEAASSLGDDILTFGVGMFDGSRMDHLSEAGREVLAGLLGFHTGDRFTAAEALEQRWFTEEEEDDEEEVGGFELSSFAAPAA
ncbi:unnamed protein product [Urochloa humidicola]